jgi:Short C-terminal domain
MPAPAPAPPPGAPPGTPPVNYVLIAGEGSSPPIKLTQQDAQRIQEDTGLPPQQLEDNDLSESMQQLGIHSVPLTPQDQATLGMAPSPQGATGSTTTVVRQPAPAANPQNTIEQQLQSLENLKEKGLISQDDYDAKKKQVLGI